MALANDLRKGRVFKYNGEPHLVLEVMHRTPGNLHAFVQVKMRSLRSGRSANTRFNPAETVDILETDTKTVEFSYNHMNTYTFMDLDTYETFDMDETVVGEAKNYMTPNSQVTILFVDGNPVEVELPSVVEIGVTEAPDAIKGDTATGATKSVLLETGIRVNTPLFVKTGDKVRISTLDGSYQGRA